MTRSVEIPEAAVVAAGGNGTPEPCAYCDIVGGHSGNCPVIS